MVQLTRESLKYENLSKKFLLSEADLGEECFRRQYYLLYQTRTNDLRERIISAARAKLGTDIKPCTMTQVGRGRALVIGTIKKRIKGRVSILRSLASYQLIIPDPVAEDRLVQDDDFLEFEDQDQVVRLRGEISMDDVATGCVVGLFGSQVRGADIFHVEEIFWPVMPPQPSYPVLKTDKYIMFISGLLFCEEAKEEAERLFALDILQKWLSGYLPLSSKEQQIVENISRLVIAGESIAITERGKEYATCARYLIRNEECPSIESAESMDKFLTKISNVMEIDVMPGAGDPATHLMPQQPIHRAVFPRSSHYGKMLNLVTNPYRFSLSGVHILGTSGENINDLRRFCSETTTTELLWKMLHWQHLAPTVPDSIDGFPFENRDPLIIDETFPHIFFTSNQSQAEYSVREFEGGRRTLLLTIPSFATTKSALIVNLRTLEVIEQSFYFQDRMLS